MKISEKRKMELYTAIHEPIMQLRIKKLRNNYNEFNDNDLFDLNAVIWESVKKSLNIKYSPPNAEKSRRK